ncbi:MAG: hypothetical protein HKP16_02025 [Xanthomonadales bacterium]|jgi:hypothetical protein|nr:hypothetical protein [Xanthomonadales bacterium]NNK32965.1 hypothetical protein [Xanthomonadales bacterium]
MSFPRGLAALLAAGLFLLPGCTTFVTVEQEFPDMVSEPRELNAVLVMDNEFRNYQAQPTEDDRIQLGPAQVVLLTKAFGGLFTGVDVVSSRQEAGPDTDLVIIPSVREVQLSSPSESYLNVYEVWIKYSLDIETADGVPIDSWFLPAYGKTPHSYLLSRSKAIQEASVVALRDAGAKLMLDFFRIPAIYGWMQQREVEGAGP